MELRNHLLELIEKYPDAEGGGRSPKPWNWCAISGNPNITMDFINANSDKPWSWCAISSSPSITLDIINAYPDKPWEWGWRGISRNPNITADFIVANLDLPWDWDGISCNTFGSRIKERRRRCMDTSARVIQKHCCELD